MEPIVTQTSTGWMARSTERRGGFAVVGETHNDAVSKFRDAEIRHRRIAEMPDIPANAIGGANDPVRQKRWESHIQQCSQCFEYQYLADGSPCAEGRPIAMSTLKVRGAE